MESYSKATLLRNVIGKRKTNVSQHGFLRIHWFLGRDQHLPTIYLPILLCCVGRAAERHEEGHENRKSHLNTCMCVFVFHFAHCFLDIGFSFWRLNVLFSFTLLNVLASSSDELIVLVEINLLSYSNSLFSLWSGYLFYL